MKRLRHLDERGVMNTLLIPFILVIVLCVAIAGFAIWSFMSRQDYKDNVDKKIAAAVEVAKQETSTAKDNEFVQKEKEPLKDYIGPEAYGSIDIKYPKTWSAYVIENSTSGTPVDGYFYPNFVPGVGNNAAYALHLTVSSKSYENSLKEYESLVKASKLKATPYQAPKVPGVVGTRLDGQIDALKQGSVVLLPLRDKTLKLAVEVNQFAGDFNNIILPNLTFSP